MKRVLTGDRPTGRLHLGHYVGSLENRIKLQNEGLPGQGYEMFNIIADLQVLTDRLETKDVEQNIKELVLDYLSVGIDPKKTNIFIQSRVPQLSELFVYLSMIVNVGRVGQNPTVKEETKATGGGNMSLGMFSLGVSQAADILAFNADLVPIGEDQLPHIEQTRDLARSFNHYFSEVFKEPEVMLSKAPRLLGLDSKNKMSKSRGNAIFLSDTKEDVEKKIKTAVTDSGKEIRFNEKEKPEVSNLMMLYHLLSGIEIKAIEDKYKNISSYKEFKDDLTGVVNNFLEPIRVRRKQAEKDADISKILKEGTQKAIDETEKVLKNVRKAMKYDYKKIFSS